MTLQLRSILVKSDLSLRAVGNSPYHQKNLGKELNNETVTFDLPFLLFTVVGQIVSSLLILNLRQLSSTIMAIA